MKINNLISAEIIADSITEKGNRITTFVLVFPRIVLAEFNTHRAVSKNSASSRAIPFKKMLQKVMKTPFIPIKWMKDHSGMQGNEYFSGWKLFLLKQLWLTARNLSVLLALILSKLGLTKQIVNRLLEPFMYHTVICTGTDFENFFALRAHDAAEIHIADLAYKMLEVYNENTPKLLNEGEWHIPFGDQFDEERLRNVAEGLISMEAPNEKELQRMKVCVATARCARVSYLNFEGQDDYLTDVKLHDRLFSMGHFSPFEHCAIASSTDSYSGNFKGFTQYRKILAGENKTDPRVIKKC